MDISYRMLTGIHKSEVLIYKYFSSVHPLVHVYSFTENPFHCKMQLHLLPPWRALWRAFFTSPHPLIWFYSLIKNSSYSRLQSLQFMKRESLLSIYLLIGHGEPFQMYTAITPPLQRETFPSLIWLHNLIENSAYWILTSHHHTVYEENPPFYLYLSTVL